MTHQRQRVAVLGASAKPARYSNQALRMLMEYGHEAIPIHPALPEIEGASVVATLDDLEGHIDTLTLYVSPQLSSTMASSIVDLRPGRVIFNPGTENQELKERLATEGIPTMETCTLVMLRTNQF